jgi:hypothetical protein
MPFSSARRATGISGGNGVVKQRASDRLGTDSMFHDAEFLPWCSLAIEIFKADPAIRREFDDDVIAFFDFAVDCASLLIESAATN